MVGVSVGEKMSEIVEGFGVSIDGAKNDVTHVALESDSGMNAGSAQGYVVSEDDSAGEYGSVATHRVVEVGELVGSPVAVSQLRGWSVSVVGV